MGSKYTINAFSDGYSVPPARPLATGQFCGEKKGTKGKKRKGGKVRK